VGGIACLGVLRRWVAGAFGYVGHTQRRIARGGSASEVVNRLALLLPVKGAEVTRLRSSKSAGCVRGGFRHSSYDGERSSNLTAGESRI
jgi:hypothetical protein